MICKKISPSVEAIGVLNPSMRVFDIIMKTEYGTSYNSYIVKGKEKTALIDTSHKSFSPAFNEALSSTIAPAEVDYIVMNHYEPDHSGLLAELMEQMPKAKIICTAAGSINMDNITNNKNIPRQIVKDGDSIDLGGLTLEFKMAPFLHWPDTMFTHLKEENILFTCDFFGAHYCEPTMLDKTVAYPKGYMKSFKEYFNTIMRPFLPYAKKGVDIVKALDPAIVATSHGPILTKDGYLPELVEMYTEWTIAEAREHKIVPVFYATAYGNTHELAKEIVRGMHIAAAEKSLKLDTPLLSLDLDKIDEAAVAEALSDYDGFMIGSPTINKAAAPIIWQVLSHLDLIAARGKPVGFFGSYGWSGEALPQMASFLEKFTLKPFKDGVKAKLTPSSEELELAYDYGFSYISENF